MTKKDQKMQMLTIEVCDLIYKTMPEGEKDEVSYILLCLSRIATTLVVSHREPGADNKTLFSSQHNYINKDGDTTSLRVSIDPVKEPDNEE